MPATGSGVAAVLPSPYYIPNTKYGALSQAPSSAASYENYSKLQKDRLGAPFFLSGRPAGAKVRVMMYFLPSGPFSIKTHCECGSSFGVLHVCALLSRTKLLAVSSFKPICNCSPRRCSWSTEYLGSLRQMLPASNLHQTPLILFWRHVAFLQNFILMRACDSSCSNKCLEQYLDKSIYRVQLTSGVSETDGSIVDTLDAPEVTVPCCKV